MSDTLAAHKQPSEPNPKQPEDEKKRIEIPSWWAIVALIMVGLVVLPIQYASLHSKKNVAQEEAQAKPAVPEAGSQTKQDVGQPQTPVAQAVAPADSQSKPNVEQADAQAKPAIPEAASQTKQDAVQAQTPVTQAVTPADSQVKPNVDQADAQTKPNVPDAASQAKQEIAQADAASKQKVALTKSSAGKLKVEDAVFFRIEGKDKQGRAAAFDFIMLSKDYGWAKGSTSQIASGGKVIPNAEAANRIFAPKVRESLSGATDLIGVGLASSGNRTEEEARALARSKTSAAWLKKAGKPGTALWTLTLGQYKGCKEQEDADSSFDRPVIFAGVRSKADGANLAEALADAINGHDNLPGRDCYSRFDMEKVR